MSKKIGIALSGGGARGIAHIGVLQALEENGISPDYISGTSAGSLVGVLYAAGHSPKEILEIVKNTSLLKIFKPVLSVTSYTGLTDAGTLKEILSDYIPEDRFGALGKKFFVCVSNLSKGQYEIYSQGPLMDWVVASCSIPVLFRSRLLNEETYVDGGLLNNLPVEPLVAQCDHVIGVNVTPISREEDLSNLLKVGYRSLDLAMWANVEPRLHQCEVVIQPEGDDYGLFDLGKADEIFALGYQAALRQLPNLKKLMESQSPSPKPKRANESLVGKMLNKSGRLRFNKTRNTQEASQADTVFMPPGTLFYVGKKQVGESLVSLISYNDRRLEEKGIIPISQVAEAVKSDEVSWVNVDGVHDVTSIEAIARQLGLHPLTAEDIVQTEERPKVEAHESYLYLIIKMLTFDPHQNMIDVEQVSLVVGKGFVVSFQEKKEDVLEPLRERLRNATGRVRKLGEDYLFFAIIDLIVSQYFVVVQAMDERIERLEARLSLDSGNALLAEIQDLKKGIFFLKKAISPLRTALNELLNGDHDLIRPKTLPYFKDLEGQVLEVLEQFDNQRNILDTLKDQFISLSGHRANEIMKVLTIMATIFIPLTFITGLYGMNFDHMPELHWKYGYFMVLGIIVVASLSLLWYFRRKRWL